MSISVNMHIDSRTSIHVDERDDESGRYVTIGVGDEVTIFINSREKLLELKRLLEMASI